MSSAKQASDVSKSGTKAGGDAATTADLKEPAPAADAKKKSADTTKATAAGETEASTKGGAKAAKVDGAVSDGLKKGESGKTADKIDGNVATVPDGQAKSREGEMGEPTSNANEPTTHPGAGQTPAGGAAAGGEAAGAGAAGSLPKEESKEEGTGKKVIKVSGVAADGGDFDAYVDPCLMFLENKS